MKLFLCLVALWYSNSFTLLYAGDPKVFAASLKDTGQLRSLLNNKSLILIGEIHGTREVPEYIAQLAALCAQNGYAVSVGLEMDEQLQADIDRFMQTGDTGTLRQSALFKEQNDGRGSAAMAGLLISLRASGKINVYGFDRWTASPAGDTGYIAISQRRDSLLAASIMERFREDSRPGKLHILLMGSGHANSGRGSFEDLLTLHYRGAALILKTTMGLQQEILNLNTGYGAGTAWNCQEQGCKVYPVPVQPVRGRTPANPFIFITGKEGPDEPYCGYIYFPAVTASLPYVAGP